MEVVGIDDESATHSAEELRKNVRRDLAPWEVAECGERNRHSGIEMSARDSARDPDAGCDTYRDVRMFIDVRLEVDLPTAQPKLSAR